MLFSTPQDPVGSPIINWVLSFPDTVEFRQLVLGALCALRDPDSWHEVGMETSETIEHFAEMIRYIRLEQSSMSYVGAIEPCVTATIPAGRLLCDGSAYLRADHPDLYDALDPAYHIDADNFNVPDLRDKMLLGEGANATGDTGGESDHVLTVDEMPVHSHGYPTTGDRPLIYDPNTGATINLVSGGNLPTRASQNQDATTNSGTGLAHNNMPPYHVVKFVIVAV